MSVPPTDLAPRGVTTVNVALSCPCRIVTLDGISALFGGSTAKATSKSYGAGAPSTTLPCTVFPPTTDAALRLRPLRQYTSPHFTVPGCCANTALTSRTTTNRYRRVDFTLPP